MEVHGKYIITFSRLEISEFIWNPVQHSVMLTFFHKPDLDVTRFGEYIRHIRDLTYRIIGIKEINYSENSFNVVIEVHG